MKNLNPLNIKPLNPDEYIEKNNVGEVTSQLIFEPSSSRFHPEGLYSEEIFGQLGSPERISNLGYINLNTKVLSPLVYKNIKDLKPAYLEILAGKLYATFNNNTKVFDFCAKTEPKAETGFNFFMKHFHELIFTETDSSTTKTKIEMIELSKTLGCATVDKLLVTPAGQRDVKETKGKIGVEEINKLYTGCMSLADGLKNIIDNDLMIKFYDGLKHNLQLKVYEVYSYLKNIYSGKTGVAQSKYSSRSVVYGSRNVITASSLDGNNPSDITYHKQNESIVPLYQACKIYQPLVIYSLRTNFFGSVFTYGTINASLIDTETLEQVYTEVDDNTVTKYLSSEFYETLINSFEDKEMRDKPVTITAKDGKEYYIMMVYDLGDTIYTFKGLSSFVESVNTDITNRISINSAGDINSIYSLGLTKDNFVFVGDSACIIHGLKDNKNNNSKLEIIVTEEDYNKILSNKNISYKEIENSIYIEKYNLYIYKNIILKNSKLLDFSSVLHQAINKDTCKVMNTVQLSDYLNYLVTKDSSYKLIKNRLTEVINNGQYFQYDKVRPLTYIEMFYIATEQVSNDKYHLVTRYPAIEVGSIYPAKTKVASTIPSRQVRFEMQGSENNYSINYPNYPYFDENLKALDYLDSLVLHPSQLKGLGGDYDGDMVNCNGLMSRESTEECSNHLDSLSSIITTDGSLLVPVETDLTRLVIYNLTR